MAAIEYDIKHRLADKQSLAIFELASRPAGIYYAKLDMAGNSILSTLLVESSSGATIEAAYYDITTGDQIGEANLLKEHTPLNSGLNTDKILIGNTHDKVFLKLSITGGSAVCSVYATIVSTSATELANALIEENQTVNFITDKAVAIGGFDEENNRWKFIRIGEDGEISVKLVGSFENIDTASATVSFGDNDTIIDKTYSVNTNVISVLCEADGYGRFTVIKNDTETLAIMRNSWNDRNCLIDLGGLKFEPTDNIKIKAENVNPSGGDATFNIFLNEG